MNSPTADAGDRTARHLTPQHLTPQDLAGLRAALDEQLRFHRRRPAGEGPGAVAPARMVLADVEAALRRMDEGRYGICHRCWLPVDRKRLRVVPQARYCAPCQRLRATDRRPATATATATGPTADTAGPVRPGDPTRPAGPGSPIPPAHPAHAAHLAHPAHPADQARPAGPAGPADLTGPARAGGR
ncbi:TraR/DksA family transcriptional regulator [Streptomyces fragilis]|uniref:TraR/DksA C4-type zinc finger protein n=1 Tax=Streptomyces fragilis TaxID=67301 RepID=A0ABV2YDQ7_9ACTN|nr:TraR/DksA C4-type zinc finger protein [Streptomyces fragilis]